MEIRIIVAIVVTVGMGLCLQPILIRRLILAGILDQVSERSSHTVPVARGGGIIVVGSAAIGILIWGGSPAVAFVLLLYGVIGAAEDLHGVTIRGRLVGQSVAGLAVGTVAAWAWSAPFEGTFLLVIAIVGLALVTFSNVFNFMDGIDGISSCSAVIAAGWFAALGVYFSNSGLASSGILIALAAFVFLPWNLLGSRVFLGDSGSYGLGASLAYMAVLAVQSGATVEAAVAPLLLYSSDTLTTLVRRLLRHEQWHRAHRCHTYQQLAAAGITHLGVTAIVASASLAVTGLAAVSLSSAGGLRIVADVAAGGVIVGYLCAPVLLRRFHIQDSVP